MTVVFPPTPPLPLPPPLNTPPLFSLSRKNTPTSIQRGGCSIFSYYEKAKNANLSVCVISLPRYCLASSSKKEKNPHAETPKSFNNTEKGNSHFKRENFQFKIIQNFCTSTHKSTSSLIFQGMTFSLKWKILFKRILQLLYCCIRRIYKCWN